MSGCFVKIDKVTFVAKTALVYDFYLIFNKCQNRETLIHQEQKFVTHFDLWVPILCKQPSAITYIFPAIKSRASFTQHENLFDFRKTHVPVTPISAAAVIFNTSTFMKWKVESNALKDSLQYEMDSYDIKHLIMWCICLLWWSVFFPKLYFYDGFEGAGWEWITWPILSFTSHPNHWCHTHS